MEKIKIPEAIITEGKYDKIKLSQIFDTVIIPTNGFDIYKNKKQLNLIRKIAKENGVIILTDSDSAGIRIRNYLKQCLGDVVIKNAYVPEIAGKEKRKDTYSKEGLLGVEGIDDSIIIDAVMSMTQAKPKDDTVKITKTDFFELGLTGQKDSAQLRAKLCRIMDIPTKISANKLLEIINVFYDKKELESKITDIKKPKI